LGFHTPSNLCHYLLQPHFAMDAALFARRMKTVSVTFGHTFVAKLAEARRETDPVLKAQLRQQLDEIDSTAVIAFSTLAKALIARVPLVMVKMRGKVADMLAELQAEKVTKARAAAWERLCAEQEMGPETYHEASIVYRWFYGQTPKILENVEAEEEAQETYCCPLSLIHKTALDIDRLFGNYS
jgi:hypothetical protein